MKISVGAWRGRTYRRVNGQALLRTLFWGCVPALLACSSAPKCDLSQTDADTARRAELARAWLTEGEITQLRPSTSDPDAAQPTADGGLRLRYWVAGRARKEGRIPSFTVRSALCRRRQSRSTIGTGTGAGLQGEIGRYAREGARLCWAQP